MKFLLIVLSLAASISAQSLADVPFCAMSCAKQIISSGGGCPAGNVKCFCELPTITEMLSANGCLMTSCKGKLPATFDTMNKICGGAGATGFPKTVPAGATRMMAVHGPRE
ncbi:CFEM domain-containing protein [Venturia nashicola]|uniref:CFEM domain-containing protein n=1 Tax=Venturia nashicola TaxID=86259 RepID=A0A4Z1NLW7_9PEZI|nr:CFEM domain-containing protein [Venturia nashicola]TLD22668.1 CFEM domain-containing protein [Venturia nashicola]